MKKQIRMLTDVAAFAAVTLVLTVALLPAGLTEAEVLSSGTAEEEQGTEEDKKDVLTFETTSETGTTTAEPPTSETTSQTTTAETTKATAPAQTTTAPTQTTTQTSSQPQSAWTEKETSGVMYVNTDGIYSREVAVIGSAKVKQYSLNDAVTVVAVTDTDYYKLEDGSFIHADYLSSSETVITTQQTQPPEPDGGDEDGNEDEDGDAGDNGDESASENNGGEDISEDDVVPLSAQPDIQGKALEMFDMVNEYRAQYGLPALQWDYNGYPAAQIRASELLQRNSHTRPDGTRYSTAYAQVGYSPSASGENIVYYYSDARSALNSLISSASHRELLLSSKFTHISIAYVYDPNSYWGYYWVQELTKP